MMFQVIGYALLDFDDAYQLTEVGTFSARYGYLAIWDRARCWTSSLASTSACGQAGMNSGDFSSLISYRFDQSITEADVVETCNVPSCLDS